MPTAASPSASRNRASWIAAGALAAIPLLFIPGLRDAANLPQSALLAAGGLAALAGFLAFGGAVRLARHEVVGIAFLGWCGCTLLWTPDPHTGAMTWFLWVGGAAVYLLLSRARLEPRALLRGVVAGAVLVAGVGLAQVAGLDPVVAVDPIGSTLANRNQAAHLAAVGLAGLPLLPVLAALGAGAVLLAYLLVAGSTTAWLMAALVLVGYGWFAADRERRLVILGGVAVALMVLTPLARARLADEPRIAMWANTVAMWATAPAAGLGLGGWSVRYPAFAHAVVPDEHLTTTRQPRRAHSEPLQRLAETGVVGALLAGLALVLAPWRADSPEHRAAVLGLAALGVAACFSFPLERAWAVLLAAALAGIAFPPPTHASPTRWVAAILLAIAALAGVYHAASLVADREHRLAIDAWNGGDKLAAARHGIRAWQAQPLDPAPLSVAGIALVLERRYAEGQVLLERAVRARPTDTAALQHLAHAYVWQRRPDDAAATMRRVKTITEGRP